MISMPRSLESAMRIPSAEEAAPLSCGNKGCLGENPAARCAAIARVSARTGQMLQKSPSGREHVVTKGSIDVQAHKSLLGAWAPAGSILVGPRMMEAATPGSMTACS